MALFLSEEIAATLSILPMCIWEVSWIWLPALLLLAMVAARSPEKNKMMASDEEVGPLPTDAEDDQTPPPIADNVQELSQAKADRRSAQNEWLQLLDLYEVMDAPGALWSGGPPQA